MPAIMIQGSNSNAGKSLIVAGLCRYFARQGLRVAPFKPQNMSNNAAAVKGGEIGRAQALQAFAAGIAATTEMNPVLLKPEGENGSQVIVNGTRFATVKAREYFQLKATLLPEVLKAFRKLEVENDLVIVEGAGSPAETNLRKGDIANMGFAEAADIPVIIVGDIERGGVIANLVGTHHVLDDADRARIKGFIVNRFRGDVRLFDEGASDIAVRTSWSNIGVLGFFDKAQLLPAEDSLELDLRENKSLENADGLNVVALRLPRIANFDDLDPISQEEGVNFAMLSHGEPVPPETDLVILPGSKSTIADLRQLIRWGWHHDLHAHVRRGGHVLGLCGGYQMLGRKIYDPDLVESDVANISGLSLLDVATTMSGNKAVNPIRARHISSGLDADGYEIHIGETSGADCDRAFVTLEGKGADGAMSRDGRVIGTYLHGLFSNDEFRRHYLTTLDGRDHKGDAYWERISSVLDEFSDQMSDELDMDTIAKLAGL